jgi:hypothetical protein
VRSPQPAHTPQNSSLQPTRTEKSTTRPQVVILGDSISRRIDGQRLLRKGNVNNLSKGGRRIEQVSEDVTSNKFAVSKADSVIIHVGTNNLQRDSVDSITTKLQKLQDIIQSHVNKNCEVAISSILHRKDRHDSKVDVVNRVVTRAI